MSRRLVPIAGRTFTLTHRGGTWLAFEGGRGRAVLAARTRRRLLYVLRNCIERNPSWPTQ